MYNRYIPQGDGSHRRRTVPDNRPSAPPRPVQQPQSCPQPAPASNWEHPPQSGFLQRLMPNNLDGGDLLVMALLLLMAGDCQEDKSTALLTLALYLFL